jgi:hypothetical protein
MPIDMVLMTEIVQGLSIKDLSLWILATPVQFWIGKPFYVNRYHFRGLLEISLSFDYLFDLFIYLFIYLLFVIYFIYLLRYFIYLLLVIHFILLIDHRSLY